MSEKNYGRNDLMAVAAFRYCLGRRTYIVDDCVSWLIEQWPNIHENAKICIQRDLEYAFQQDEAKMFEYSPLGDACDKAAWAKVRELGRKE